MSESRQYDIVVFGASGYTGKLTAEHISTNLPTDLRWALAGRSANKLEDVAAVCKDLNPDRIQPSIEICNLDDTELAALAKKTAVIIATVGPYCLYGEKVFKACSENGTHYLDVTGEVAYVADMIKKYEKTAKSSGAIMIPQIGIESAPADLVTWSLVNMIKGRLSVPTAEVVLSVQISSKPSGGTMNTVLSILDVYSLKQLAAAHAPYGISPIPGPKTGGYSSIFTKIFGIRTVPDLGILTSYFASACDVPIVQRTWGLLGGEKFYGPNFSFSEYMKVRNHLAAVVVHLGLALGSFLLALPFFRSILRTRVYQPGDGPTKEQTKNDRLEYRAIATPDIQTPNPPRAFCRAYYDGSVYGLTGIFLAEAAICILKDKPDLSGGVYTPACLGQKFIDRLHSSGFRFEKKFYEN